MKCIDCKYFRWETQYRKLCVRYPPAAIPTTSGVDTYWPVVNETDWCGEFQAKISSKQQEHA